jgi:hypothetical protein
MSIGGDRGLDENLCITVGEVKRTKSNQVLRDGAILWTSHEWHSATAAS